MEPTVGYGERKLARLFASPVLTSIGNLQSINYSGGYEAGR